MKKFLIIFAVFVALGCSKESELCSVKAENGAQIEKTFVKMTKGSKVTFRPLDKQRSVSVLEFKDNGVLELNGKPI